jgi:DNA-binding MarR family transcriptional regulator
VADSSETGTAAASPVMGIADAATSNPHTGMPHVVTAQATTSTAHAAMAAAGCPLTGPTTGTATGDDKLDHDILDALIKLFRQMLAQGEKIAERFGVPLFCIKALHVLDTSMAMKELGQRMECDPSFVTAIADALEKLGLARREACTADRRVKNLVLSTDGIELKRQLEREMVASMPWSHGLDIGERESFLALILRLTEAAAISTATGASSPAAGASGPVTTKAAMPADATASSPAAPTGGGRAREVSDALDIASAG